jgi:hypothetical protein
MSAQLILKCAAQANHNQISVCGLMWRDSWGDPTKHGKLYLFLLPTIFSIFLNIFVLKLFILSMCPTVQNNSAKSEANLYDFWLLYGGISLLLVC